MTTLRFDISHVRKLIANATADTDWRASFSDLLNKDYAKPDAKPDDFGLYAEEDIDTKKIGPKLWLVKDQGCYLMNNARDFEKVWSGKRLVAYADNYGPEVSHQTLRAALGGDDFVETIDITDLTPAITDETTALIIEITENDISIVLETMTRAPKR